jgi:opacity protein-like surface antigen
LLTTRLMRITILPLVGIVMCAAAPPAAAQSHNVPEAGTVAISGSFSPTKTESAFLDNGLGIAGNVEGYLARFLSVRAQVGAAFWDIEGLSFGGTVRPVFGVANAVVGWTAGDWRPYVTGGGGVYRYNFTEPALLEASDVQVEAPDEHGSRTKSGWDAGAGVEYFFTPEATVTLEALFHKVELIPTPRATLGFKGSFWAFTVGAKKYF